MRHKFFTFIEFCIIGVLIFSGCSSNLKFSKRSKLMVPAGVDSSVAVAADSVADRLFVSLEREKRSEQHKTFGKKKTSESDTLWKYLSDQLDASVKVDSARAIAAFNQGARNLQELARLNSRSNMAEEMKRAEVLRLMEQARKNFERAVILNPYDAETKSWLARVYQNLAARFLDTENNLRAAKVLENLVRLEKGEHSLYARLAEIYYAMEKWQSANYNFTLAESVLRNGAGLDFNERDYTQDVEIDKSMLFYYVYYQGDTEIKMHDAARGLASLNRALQYASTDQERADIHTYIDWINWDDGNTKAVELRDEFIAMQEEQNYKDAAKGFLKLIPQLRTRRAIDETVWRLSVLEFQFLNRKNKGIDRLKHVVALTPKDANDAPVDSTYKKYFDSYGVMCHNLGLENYNKNRKFAFMYFKQAVAINWESRAKSNLEIAKMSRNSPKAVIESCEQALAERRQLDKNELMQTYQLLVEALKRTGKFDQARTLYAEWSKLSKSNLRSSR